MTNQDNGSLLGWILGGVFVALAGFAGIVWYVDNKEKKRLENIVKLIDWNGVLDKKNSLHTPLILVSEELVLMLKKSIVKEKDKYIFRPEYPYSLDLIARSTYEQTIKLYLTLSRVRFNKRALLSTLEETLTEYFNKHGSDSEICFYFNQTKELNIRDEGNYAAHSPEKSKNIAPFLDNVEIMANFINRVMRSATLRTPS